MMERKKMKLRRVVWCAVVSAILLGATPGSEATTKRRRTRPFVVRAHVVDFTHDTQDTHSNRRRRERSFEGYDTHTIEFDVFRRGRSTLEQPTQIKLYLPNGDLYSAVDLETVESPETNPRRKSRQPAATARVRVSGTVITRYRLYGDWRADICWRTGSVTSCRRGLNFDIY